MAKSVTPTGRPRGQALKFGGFERLWRHPSACSAKQGGGACDGAAGYAAATSATHGDHAEKPTRQRCADPIPRGAAELPRQRRQTGTSARPADLQGEGHADAPGIQVQRLPPCRGTEDHSERHHLPRPRKPRSKDTGSEDPCGIDDGMRFAHRQRRARNTRPPGDCHRDPQRTRHFERDA